MKNVGENGCYILSILESIGIQNTDAQLNMIKDLVDAGFLAKDLYVKDNEALAARLGCSYQKLAIKPATDVYIKEYFNERTGFTHFVLCVKDVDYDTLDDSVTVKEGYVKSYRIFKRK